MKVLVLSDYFHSLNNRIAEIELFIRLKNIGIDITVVADGWDECINYYRSHNVNIIRRIPKSKYDLSYIKFINEKIKSDKIDILHLFSNNTMRNGVVASYFTNVKVIAYFGSTSLYWHDLSAYLKYLNPRIDCILCNSKHVYKHVQKQLLNKKKAVHVYKGIEESWYSTYKAFDYTSLGISKDAVVVISIARNTKVKGVRYFLEATNYVKTDKNVHFVLVGKHMDTNEIIKLVNNSPYKGKIHILGYRTDAIELIKGSDVYCQTSLNEGLGRATAEAAICKKPIVITDAGGCTELIEDGKGGFISPVKDSKSIARNISALVNNEELRIKMGNYSYNYIKTKFSMNNNVKGVFNVYQSLLKVGSIQ